MLLSLTIILLQHTSWQAYASTFITKPAQYLQGKYKNHLQTPIFKSTRDPTMEFFTNKIINAQHAILSNPPDPSIAASARCVYRNLIITAYGKFSLIKDQAMCGAEEL